MPHREKPLVLLVDDDKDLRDVLSTKLIANGFQVIEAAKGIEGIEKAKQFQPDLILLDLEMPEVDGVETLNKLLSEPETKQMRVVFLTNYGEPRNVSAWTDEKFARELGAIDYIKKTDDLDKIVGEVKMHVDTSAFPAFNPSP